MDYIYDPIDKYVLIRESGEKLRIISQDKLEDIAFLFVPYRIEDLYGSYEPEYVEFYRVKSFDEVPEAKEQKRKKVFWGFDEDQYKAAGVGGAVAAAALSAGYLAFFSPRMFQDLIFDGLTKTAIWGASLLPVLLGGAVAGVAALGAVDGLKYAYTKIYNKYVEWKNKKLAEKYKEEIDKFIKENGLKPTIIEYSELKKLVG